MSTPLCSNGDYSGCNGFDRRKQTLGKSGIKQDSTNRELGFTGFNEGTGIRREKDLFLSYWFCAWSMF